MSDVRRKLTELIPYLVGEQIIDAFEQEMIEDAYLNPSSEEDDSWEGYSPQYWLKYRMEDLSEECLEEALLYLESQMPES